MSLKGVGDQVQSVYCELYVSKSSFMLTDAGYQHNRERRIPMFNL